MAVPGLLHAAHVASFFCFRYNSGRDEVWFSEGIDSGALRQTKVKTGNALHALSTTVCFREVTEWQNVKLVFKANFDLTYFGVQCKS